MIRRGEPIIGGGAGTGLSAKCEEAGGIDLIVIYNSGRYRMAGRGSLAGMLAYGNANEIVRGDGARGAAGGASTRRSSPASTAPIRSAISTISSTSSRRSAFSGVQNFPTVGLIDGVFRANLEETGMGYGLEVDLMRRARAKDLLTTPYVFDPAQATAMAEAGADIVVAHMGLTVGGAIGAATALELDDCVARDRRHRARRRSRCATTSSCSATAARSRRRRTRATSWRAVRDCHGFYGASSMERLPVETALTARRASFKAITRAAE